MKKIKKILNRNPFVKRVLIIGTPILVAYYLALIFAPGFSGMMMMLIAIPFALPVIKLIVKVRANRQNRQPTRVTIVKKNRTDSEIIRDLESQISNLDWDIHNLKNR